MDFAVVAEVASRGAVPLYLLDSPYQVDGIEWNDEEQQ